MVVENELSDAQREAADASNDNMTTGITGVPTIVDESPEVVIDEKSDSKGETEYLWDEVNVHDIYRDITLVV